MQDSINVVASESGFHFRSVADFPFDKGRDCWHRKALGMGQIVIDHDTMPGSREQVGYGAPYVTSATGDECVQLDYLLIYQ
jgi:hypothetical protein